MKTLWLLLAAGLYAVSLILPALVYESETVWIGARAAVVALFGPLYFGLPLGFLLALYYPLVGITLFAILKSRAFATGAAIALVSTMALWGLRAPDRPEGNVLSVPGGDLGWGFWLWLAAGFCLLMASLAGGGGRKPVPGPELLAGQVTRRRLERGTVYGLVFAGVVFLSELAWRAATAETASHAEARRRAVEAEKRQSQREATPAPSP